MYLFFCLFFFFFKQKTAYEMLRSLVGSEMCIRDRSDDGAVEDVEGREQCRRAMTLVVVGHRSGAALLHRQTGLSAVERLDLALLIDREDDSMGGRIDIKACLL